jgi:hypothetical protein
VGRIVGFLNSDSDVFDQLGAERLTPEKLREQANGAKKLGGKLPSLPSDDLRDLLASSLRRVVVGDERFQIMIGRNELCQLLKNGAKGSASSVKGTRQDLTFPAPDPAPMR